MALDEAGNEVVDLANDLVDRAQDLLDKTVDAGQDLGGGAAKHAIGAVSDAIQHLGNVLKELSDSVVAKKE